MAITIDGVKVSRLAVTRDNDGKPSLTGDYQLVTNTGIVVAKQSFNGYNEVSVGKSPQTEDLLRQLLESVQSDINKTVGLG